MSETPSAIPDLNDTEHWRMVGSRNLAAQFESIADGLGKRTLHGENLWASDASFPHPYPNSATLLAPLAEADAGEVITRLARFYAQEPGAPWMLWSAWPTPDLAPYGMHPAGQTPLMVRPPAPLPEASQMPLLRIIEATDAQGLLDGDSVMAHGYPIPEMDFPRERLTSERTLGGPMRVFVGYLGNEPVSCASACLGKQEVGIYSVATLPPHRGKGYGAALTATAVATAPHLPAVLEASTSGEPIYRRMGFVTVTPFTLWVRPRG